MTSPVPNTADVLRQLGEYQAVAFRIALRREAESGWTLHTLVIDAIPESYARDEEFFRQRYNLQRFVYSYRTAAFIAGVREGSEIVSWFDATRDITIPAPGGAGTSTRVFTTQMPELQDPPLSQPYYYRTTQNDSFDRMRWPHTVYSFYRTQMVPESYDDTRLVGTAASGSRSFLNFKRALIELIYGETDWEKSQNWSTEPRIAVRIVKEKPFFADIKQTDDRHVAVAVHGLNMLDTVIQLSAPGGLFQEQQVFAPDTYLLELDHGVPQRGQLNLIQGENVLDENEWDSRYAPLPGAPVSVPSSPTFPPAYLGTYRSPVDIENLVTGNQASSMTESQSADATVPLAIHESLAEFRKDHPEIGKTGFIMMQFGATETHNVIAQTIKDTLASHGLEAVRADDKEYHSDLYNNIQTYLHGCGFGIAVFERIESDNFNPNVALEVGYMLALGKPICFLKDKTLRTLHADLIGKLYKQFDPSAPKKTIPNELNKWLGDHGLA